ncbi:MAG: sigma-70 family RNA polymerase sigma factor [Phycisphaerales bacterium JB063]
MPMDQKQLVTCLMRDRAKLFAFIWAIVHDEHLAEDVLQDVSALVLEKRDEIESESHLLGWMRRAARFRAFKALDKRGKRPLSLDEEVVGLLEEHWERLDRQSSSDRVDALQKCLEQLTPYTSELIRLRYAEGLSGGRLATTVGRKVETVYVALSRTHRALRECIERRMGKGGGA